MARQVSSSFSERLNRSLELEQLKMAVSAFAEKVQNRFHRQSQATFEMLANII